MATEKPAAQESSGQTHANARRFEFVDVKSSKFWEIRVNGDSFGVCYGKIGTDGQTQTKQFADAATATKQAEKLIAEKVGKGYQEIAAATKQQPTKKQAADKAPIRKTGSASVARILVNFPEITVNIRKESPAVARQVLRASTLRTKILDQMRKEYPRSEVLDGYDGLMLRLLVQFSAQTFGVILTPCPTTEVDRMGSMLSGPFYTSAEYPIPSARSNILYPVVQLDLREASVLIQKPIGDGLLQLWYDMSTFECMIRVIPRNAVRSDVMTTFELVASKKFFDDFVPMWWWESDPVEGMVQVISGYEPDRFRCQDGYIDLYSDEIHAGMSRGLLKNLNEFMKVAKYLGSTKMTLKERIKVKKVRPSSAHIEMFGTFYPIQYSAADAGAYCLFSLTWGSSGGAQVFYEMDEDGEVSFSFWAAGR